MSYMARVAYVVDVNEIPAAVAAELARLGYPVYRTNITYATFEAGHMMYVNLPDLKKMHRVLEDFLK